jgi:hypothetical protein
MRAAAFSIQPLEGSCFGTFELWILNDWVDGNGGRRGELIARRWGTPSAGEVITLTRSPQAGASDMRVALVFRQALDS